jgi:hypothetical protein
MENKDIYEEFCNLMNEYDGLLTDLCDALDGPVDLEEILGYKPDWEGLDAKETKFKERLKSIVENWIKLQELKHDNE